MTFAGLTPACWGYLSPMDHSILRFALNKGEHLLGRDMSKNGVLYVMRALYAEMQVLVASQVPDSSATRSAASAWRWGAPTFAIRSTANPPS
jgi:hypothetical protein